jgi:hypothetical protein
LTPARWEREIAGRHCKEESTEKEVRESHDEGREGDFFIFDGRDGAIVGLFTVHFGSSF